MELCEFTGRCHGAAIPSRNKLGVECHANEVMNSPSCLPDPFLGSGAKYWFHREYSVRLNHSIYCHIQNMNSKMGDAECAWSLYPLGNYTKKKVSHSKQLRFKLLRQTKMSSICSGYMSFFNSLYRTCETLALFSPSTFVFMCRHNKKQPLSTMKEWKNICSYMNRLRNKKHQQFKQNHIRQFVFHFLLSQYN